MRQAEQIRCGGRPPGETTRRTEENLEAVLLRLVEELRLLRLVVLVGLVFHARNIEIPSDGKRFVTRHFANDPPLAEVIPSLVHLDRTLESSPLGTLVDEQDVIPPQPGLLLLTGFIHLPDVENLSPARFRIDPDRDLAEALVVVGVGQVNVDPPHPVEPGLDRIEFVHDRIDSLLDLRVRTGRRDEEKEGDSLRDAGQEASRHG